MLKLLGRRTSNNVQKVLWLLDEMGLPCEQEDYGGPYGKTRTPQYLAMNPNGTVPTLIDGDTVLWESNTIARYLAGKYESPLYPKDLAARAQVEKWMDWQLASLAPAFRPLFIALVREGRGIDELGQAHAATAGLFKLLDEALAGRQYIAGNAMTLADIAVGPMIHRWFALGLAQPDTVRLRQLWDRYAAMPVFQRNVMIDLA